MKFDLRQPCVECPFRRKHPAGWLGPWDPKELMDFITTDGIFPCHRTIESDDRKLVEPEMQQCAGAALFMNNSCKLHKDPFVATYQKLMRETATPALKASVFNWKHEFIEHHSKVGSGRYD
jgi:hypothetical protein